MSKRISLRHFFTLSLITNSRNILTKKRKFRTPHLHNTQFYALKEETMLNQIQFNSHVFQKGIFSVLITTVAILIGYLIGKDGFMMGVILLTLPIGLLIIAYFFTNTYANMVAALMVGFFASGIGRYVSAPWGLLVDIFLAVGWLSLVFRVKKVDWSPLKSDIMTVALVWYGLVVLEIINPESNGPECWFYAMRGNGFYQLLGFGLVFMTFQDKKYLDKFLILSATLSVLGTLWGLRQFVFGVDDAEYRWLYVEGYAFTHMLAGVLRVFSFYSDAGQFGSSQAMFALMCGIIALAPVSRKMKIFFTVAALFNFIGFAVSGTRGAVGVPAIGVLTYLFLSKNYKILAIGLITVGSVFFFLKYTMAMQHVEQVRRMRTAFDPNDASFQVRLKNQRTFGRHLASRPFGGGIGAAGYWGYRYAPYSLLGNTATDSYYVKIWAETGIIGICLHLFMFGFFIGKGGFVVWHIRDEALRFKTIGIYCSMCGVMFSSYGNQVYSQMPTGMIMGLAIPLIFLAPKYDDQITAENSKNTEGVALN
jgi:O-Antigen ligase